MTAQQTSKKGPIVHLRAVVCLFLAFVLVMDTVPLVPQAYAAGEDKPEKVIMQVGSQTNTTDVMKEVATLDLSMNKDYVVPFFVYDKYNSVSYINKRRLLVLEDSSGKQTTVYESATDKVGISAPQMVVGSKLKLITFTKDRGDKDFVKRYEQQLNVRFTDTKKAEKKPGNATSGGLAGISKDGGSWSFTDGLSYTFRNTGFSFLDNTTMSLNALHLPLVYKHETDGTTIVGINCSPEDKTFYNAVKNGNVWEKYSTDELAKKTGEMDKGWSGKKFGTWGGKGFSWTACGYMEFNTRNPDAPRAVNLVISMGLSAEGHAQYLCFTGTLTFTVGGKGVLTGKLSTPKNTKDAVEALANKDRQLGLGAYAGLELYIGIGLQYVASVGAYGKGQINIDFKILPQFYLDKIKLSGELGAKAKLFGFTIYTWKIWSGDRSLYEHKSEAKTEAAVTAEGTADSPFTVSADTVYPMDSRDYLDEDTLLNAQSALAAEAATSSTSILKGIYGETELSCANTNDGPVIAYIADAAQVGDSSRDAANRSALVYSRYKNGAWTAPKIIDTTTTSGKYADYSPHISSDGDNCYVTWLAADSKIESGATLGSIGKKLDVNVAAITKDDKVSVEKVCEESNESGTMPASPKAVKVGNDLYVGWYTNQTSGQSGEVIGVSGTHNIRLYKKSAASLVTAAEANIDAEAVDLTTVENSALENEGTEDVLEIAEDKSTEQSTSEEAAKDTNTDASSASDEVESVRTETNESTEETSSVEASAAESTMDASSVTESTSSTSVAAEGADQSADESASATSSAATSSAAESTLESAAESTSEESTAQSAASTSDVAEDAAQSTSDVSLATESTSESDEIEVAAESVTEKTDALTIAETAAKGWTKVSEVTSGQSGAITSFDVGSYGGTAACAWSLDSHFSSSAEEKTLNGVKALANSTLYYLTPNSNQAQIVATGAANAQFAKRAGTDVLTYAIRIDANDGTSAPYLSVQGSPSPGSADTIVLDGSKVYLPTPYYKITGDIGQGRAGNISFLKAGSGSCDIQALVTTGASPTDWTSIVEATADTATITDYCATYTSGKPLFVYTTERVSAASSEGVSAEAADDGAVDLNQTTEESLKHLSVTNIAYDEYEIDSDDNMPVTVSFENDGMLDVPNVDLWVLEDGNATKVASSDTAVALDDVGSISFLYTVPSKDTFTKDHQFTVYAAPADTTVTAEKITREIDNGSAMTASFGAASLSLDAVHQIVDEQESIVATVTNDGIASHGAKLLFINSDTDEELMSMDVPELGENETFTGTFDASNGYFQKDGIKNITITLKDDGTEAGDYEINNTEFVSTWDVDTTTETPQAQAQTQTQATIATKSTKIPNTGDKSSSASVIALAAFGVIACAIVVRVAEKEDERF